jgi:hypothetical protein
VQVFGTYVPTLRNIEKEGKKEGKRKKRAADSAAKFGSGFPGIFWGGLEGIWALCV